MNQHDITMPATVQAVMNRLLISISRASTNTEVDRAGQRADGFVLGIETLKALPPASIEALYLVVEQAVEARVGEISAQAPKSVQ